MKDLHERLECSTALNLIAPNEFLGSLISAGASLASGLLGASSAQSARQKDLRDQDFRNQLNRGIINNMNADLRRRAEAAAQVPIVTTNVTDGWDNTTVTTSGSVDIAAMMKAAEASGFNPVTFLRNGGMAAYAKTVSDSQRKYNETSTSTTTGSNAMEAALAGSTIFQYGAAPSHQGLPTTASAFGNAITAGANQWVADYNQQQQNDFQMQLMNAQLAGNNQAASSRARGMGGNGNSNYTSRSGSVPVANLGGSVNTSKGSGALSSAAKIPNLYFPYVDNSSSGGGKTVWLPNPDIADSEQLAAALAGTGFGNVKQPITNTNVDNRKQTTIQFTNPAFASPGRPQGATLGDIGNAISKYFEPWWNNQPISGTSW